MGDKASHIVLSVWGSPLSPTKTRITLDQQPDPLSFTCFTVKLPKETEKSKNKMLFFRRRGMPDAKKTKEERQSGTCHRGTI